MTSTERIVRRYRVAAMAPEKMDALLQKIRKGATASLTWANLGEVFQVLIPGWFLEKSTGFIQLHGDDGKADFYSSLPAVAKAGKLYVTELGPLVPARHGGDDTEFSYKAFLGTNAWKVVTPAGKQFLAMPSKFDVGDGSLSPKSYKVINHGKIVLY